MIFVWRYLSSYVWPTDGPGLGYGSGSEGFGYGWDGSGPAYAMRDLHAWNHSITDWLGFVDGLSHVLMTRWDWRGA
jgi:hypothetical protein